MTAALVIVGLLLGQACGPAGCHHAARVLSCHDLDRLDRWLVRAALAASAHEVTSEL